MSNENDTNVGAFQEGALEFEVAEKFASAFVPTWQSFSTEGALSSQGVPALPAEGISKPKADVTAGDAAPLSLRTSSSPKPTQAGLGSERGVSTDGVLDHEVLPTRSHRRRVVAAIGAAATFGALVVAFTRGTSTSPPIREAAAQKPVAKSLSIPPLPPVSDLMTISTDVVPNVVTAAPEAASPARQGREQTPVGSSLCFPADCVHESAQPVRDSDEPSTTTSARISQ
jgi:hypothetical protein